MCKIVGVALSSMQHEKGYLYLDYIIFSKVPEYSELSMSQQGRLNHQSNWANFKSINNSSVYRSFKLEFIYE